MAKQRPIRSLSDLDGLVFSSETGDQRKQREREAAGGGGRVTGANGNPGGRVKVRRETAGRRGKTATTVSDVPGSDDDLRALAGRLKKRCGVGGSAKNGVIEIQGDHRDLVVELLRAEGYDVVLAGG
ncbi:MAG: stress response translation initiation inhibitor YciH [Patulibacter sp.]|nr:stress response translation initiation inhibitor YciH [Patulibacter sp.]